MKRQQLLARIFLCAMLFPSTVQSAPESLSGVLSRVREHQGVWVAYHAEITARFSSDSREAVCKGTLNYHRLDEKILFRCFNDQNQLLFIFSTRDTQFELYLASGNRLYRGHVLDLELAPGIESALKPLTLFRALKPMAVPQKDSELTVEQGQSWIRVRRLTGSAIRPFRELRVSSEGDVPYEIYYDFTGKPAAVIERTDFYQESPKGISRTLPVNLPRKIMIRDFSQSSSMNGITISGNAQARENRTEIVFDSLTLEDQPGPEFWETGIPADAQVNDIIPKKGP